MFSNEITAQMGNTVFLTQEQFEALEEIKPNIVYVIVEVTDEWF